jgi:hypothetical protein
MNFSSTAPSDLAYTLSRVLRLKSFQRAQLRAIVAEAGPQLDELYRPPRTDFAAALERLNRQIRPLLRVEQQKRFDALIALRGAEARGPAAE